MSDENFLTIESIASQAVAGPLPRAIVLVTRETVTGFTPDPLTGLIKINSSDKATFDTGNSTKYGLRNALRLAFGQTFSFPYVYILSNATGVTTEDLDKANTDSRAWSILTLVDRWNGEGGATPADSTDYFEDLTVIKTWGPRSKKKVVLHTFSIEEVDGDPIVLPTELALGGSIGSDGGFKTIVCNSSTEIAEDVQVYDNIAIAWAAFCLNGPEVSRSWGSFSDAHDFLLVSPDTYSQASRNVIANASLGQYNASKDRAGSSFVFDTQMNSGVNPANTKQLETILAIDYIDDYVYVYVRNALQAAGFTGLPNDDAGIQIVLGLTRAALQNCFLLNLILSKEDLSGDYSAGALTAKQVTALSSNWQTTGIWPSGVVFGTIRPYSSAHYVKINFTYT